MSPDPRVIAVQRFVDQHLAGKSGWSYSDLLAVRDALRPYVEDMDEAGWYPDCEECYAQLRAEWQDVNRRIEHYRLAALQRWRASRKAPPTR